MVVLTSVLVLLQVVRGHAAHRDHSWGSWIPSVVDHTRNLTYQGVYESGVEAYLGIQFGQDTGGQNRFKPPQAYTYERGTTVLAQSPGPACPQPLGAKLFPLYLSNITEISEACLLLNVKRPVGTRSKSKLPVMVFIHGGSFIGGSKDELVTQPSGLILQSIANRRPVMHVGLNYRLGSFGFAQSDALHSEGSENAGLRDQRLGIEWVRDNIAAFGGDPNRITIFGQSSGGLAVGLQIMAFGASQGIPFQQAICESQALEGGITGNFTRAVMSRLADATGCNSTALDSAETVSCLRSLSTQQVLDAQTDTYANGPADNIGDSWLPVVDGDFLPEAPSELVAQGRFGNVTSIMGWTDGDLDIIIPQTVRTANDTDQFLRAYLPGFNDTSISAAEQLYPVDEFSANPGANLTAEFYRTSRMVRDLLMVCMPVYYGKALNAKGLPIYHYDQNQTFLNPALTSLGIPNLGVVHTSEFAYVFGNLSHYDVDNFPYQPNASDYALLRRQSRSWSSFAAGGQPSPSFRPFSTLRGWKSAYAGHGTKPSVNDTDVNLTENVKIYVIGGGREGYVSITNGKNAVLNGQRLQERCNFWNSRDIIRQLGY